SITCPTRLARRVSAGRSPTVSASAAITAPSPSAPSERIPFAACGFASAKPQAAAEPTQTDNHEHFPDDNSRSIPPRAFPGDAAHAQRDEALQPPPHHAGGRRRG